MTTKNSSAKPFAVVTGASQGLGKEFALALARLKMNLILVSLPNQGLSALSAGISKTFGVRSEFYETDLSVKENVLELSSWINNRFSVSILINNAGIGGTKKFTDASVHYINDIMQVNVVATSLLTHQLLPNLMAQQQSYVLNVSSMAAFSPIGYKTVYPASKTFIHSFSRGLNEELKDTNVFVSVVNPGAMRTSEEITKRIEKQGYLGRLTLLQPEKVAKHCISRLLKKDSVIMLNAFSWAMLKIIPIWIMLPLMSRAVKRELVS
jgi:uncharacterized protein